MTLELGQADKAERRLRGTTQKRRTGASIRPRGAALTSRGKQPKAQAQFAKALVLAPEHPSAFNNLALSSALDGIAEEAEKTEAEKLLLRAHRARGGIPQNLTLVLGLSGTFDATKAAAGALPAATASANIAYLKALTGAKTAQADADVDARNSRRPGVAELSIGRSHAEADPHQPDARPKQSDSPVSRACASARPR